MDSPSSTADSERLYFSSDLCCSGNGEADRMSNHGFIADRFLSSSKNWWRARILLEAISALNHPVSVRFTDAAPLNRPLVYVTNKNRIEISGSGHWNPFAFRRAFARGLIYAFDNARAEIDYQNVDHVSCTTIRAFNISGECDLWSKWLDYFGDDPLGKDMYSMKQRCVKKKAEEQMVLESHNSADDIRQSIDRVWERCFRDHWPFTAEPHMDTRFRDSPMRRDA
jgi:hypothetical protein